MLVVRGTKKLRDRVKGPVAAGDDDVSTGVLGEWFATALFWKPQVALLVNARTFVSVFVPLAPAGKLHDRIPDQIAQVLALHGVDPATVAAERQAMAEVRIAPTDDHSVVGVMNELAFLGEHFFDGDLIALSLRMAGTPVGPLRSSHRFPDEALAALLGATAPSDEPLAEVIRFPGMATPDPTVAARPSRTAASVSATPVASGAALVFQLNVTLLNTKPPVWRRILVDGGITLDRLHEVIQAAFGWGNCHLHEFEVAHRRYGAPDPDFDFGPPTIDERTARLAVIAGEGMSFHYTYDFGDDWRHKITVRRSPRPGAARPCPTASVVAGLAHPRIAVALGATRTSSNRSPAALRAGTTGSTSSATTSTPAISPSTSPGSATAASTADRSSVSAAAQPLVVTRSRVRGAAFSGARHCRYDRTHSCATTTPATSCERRNGDERRRALPPVGRSLWMQAGRRPSGGAVDRDLEGGAEVVHPGVAEPSDAFDQHGDRDTLD